MLTKVHTRYLLVCCWGDYKSVRKGMSNYEYAINIIKNWERVEEGFIKNGLSVWGKPNCSTPRPYSLADLNNPSNFRLKPEPTYVPMTRDDMPVAFVVRVVGKDSETHYCPYSVDSNGVGFNGGRFKFENLANDTGYQYSTDRKVWHPFRKEAK